MLHTNRKSFCRQCYAIIHKNQWYSIQSENGSHDYYCSSQCMQLWAKKYRTMLEEREKMYKLLNRVDKLISQN